MRLMENEAAALDRERRQSIILRLIRPVLRLLTRNARWQRPRTEPTSLLRWGQRYLANHFSRPPSNMHRWLDLQFDGLHLRRGSKINVVGPRGGAKSTVATLAYVLRAAVEGWEPYIWIISDTMEQARLHLANVNSELRENWLLKKHYHHLRHPGPRSKVDCILLGNGTVIEAYGTGQKLRGRRRGRHRPSLIVCDDLQNDGHMQSAWQRESSSTWFHSALLKAGDKRTNVLNLATALHRDALAMQLHQMPGWISARFRAIERWPAALDLWKQWEAIYTDRQRVDAVAAARQFYEYHRAAMDAGAKLLWPEQEDLYTLMKMRLEEGHAAFEREKQCSPTDPSRCEWPEDYFGADIWFDRWPDELQLVAIALDPSKGHDARHGDYSAFAVLGVDRRGILYIDADLARRPTPQIVADGVALCRRHNANVFGVEANQFQELLADEFVAEFARQGITSCTPCAIHNHTNKYIRIRRLGPYLSQRRMLFKRDSACAHLLVDQLRDFPLGTHDDGPDALEMALRLGEEVHHNLHTSDGLGSRLPINE